MWGFDHYVSPDQQTLWYLRIHGEGSNSPLNKTHYTFATREPINVLENTDIRFVTHSGSIPIGPANCDISPHGIVLVGQRPGESRPQTWISDPFYIPLSNLSENSSPKVELISTPDFDGKCSRPVFSLDGKSVAFIRAKDWTKILGRNSILLANILESYVAFPLNIYDT